MQRSPMKSFGPHALRLFSIVSLTWRAALGPWQRGWCSSRIGIHPAHGGSSSSSTRSCSQYAVSSGGIVHGSVLVVDQAGFSLSSEPPQVSSLAAETAPPSDNWLPWPSPRHVPPRVWLRSIARNWLRSIGDWHGTWSTPSTWHLRTPPEHFPNVRI